MEQEAIQSEDLAVLNRISEALNREAEVEGALNSALGLLVNLMGLETAWISLANRSSLDQAGIEGFTLGAHCNLPPGLAPDIPGVWNHSCTCQDLMQDGDLTEAYTEVSCSRLASVVGGRNGLTVHASTPLVSADRQLGILNIAAKDWDAFNPRSLSLLTIVGNQIGVALERAQLFDFVKERHINEQEVMLVFSNHLLSGRGRKDLTNMLVNEVASLLSADACSLLLLDEDNSRLAFVAANGWIEDPVALNRTVPLNAESGPGKVMRSQEPLLENDLWWGETTSWSPPWLEAEGFRGHAVVPLVVEDRSIGTLVVNNRSPRMLNSDELRVLGLMANQAAIAIETARLRRGEIELLQRDQELDIGGQMQRSLMPTVYPHVPGYEFAVAYEAARRVGGDFFDFCWPRGEGKKLGLIIGDVAGKGVPAALFMAMSRTNIRSAALSGRSPGEALKRANELILNDSQADVFLTTIYAMLDPDTGQLSYANGGHNRPLFIQAATREIRELSARGIILGQFDDIELEEETVEFAPGDAVVLYTDGVTEAINPDEQPFGEDRLNEILQANVGASAETIVSAISQAVVEFAGSEPQADDFTILAIARTQAN